MKSCYLKISSLLVLAFCLSSCAKIEEFKRTSMTRIRVKAMTNPSKGTVIRTADLQNQGRFAMDAYVDKDYADYTVEPIQQYRAGSYISSGGEANVFFENSTWNLKPETPWVSDVDTRFWCYAPVTLKAGSSRAVSSNSSNPGLETLGFNYNRPGSITKDATMLNAGALANETADDATKMDDIIFAFAKHNYNERVSDAISIVFYHALSQVRFAVSPDDGTFDRTLQISQIALKNIPTGGECTFIGTADDPKDKFVWTPGANAGYCQTFNTSFDTKPADWTRTYYTDEHDETHTLYTTENVFFTTPHTLNSAVLDIVFKDGENYIEVPVTLPNDTWYPGKYYTYKITAREIGRTIRVTVTLIDWNNIEDKLFM